MNRSGHGPTSPPQTYEEASAWFVQFRLGDMGAREREAFNAWLCRSPDNIRAYMQIAQTYVDLPALKDRISLDVEALLARERSAGNVIRLVEPAPSFSSPRPRRGGFFALAAGVAVLGVLGFLAVEAHRAPTYATSRGEQRSIALPDGSTVVLNVKSRVRVRLSERERRIDLLEGQALFQVAKDRDRPFVVHTGDAVIRAVGTEFDVYRREGGTAVTVIEGRVAITSSLQTESATPRVERIVAADETPQSALPAAAVLVSAGQKLIHIPGAAMEPQAAKPAAAIAWTRRRVVFDGTSLPEVVKELNRYNTRTLVIQGEGLDDLRISGSYSSADPAALMRFLEVEFDLTVREHENQVVISRR